MKNKLFIPKTLKVGYQNREDTYMGKLSYIIYFDDKGKLRKETGWQNWRDKSIEPIEVPNEPHSGFFVNKGVQRYSWFTHGLTKAKMRIYDDRGMEFEIDMANLTHVLMHTDCVKRELEGEFVYAWDGKEMILLSTKSQEYQDSLAYSQLRDTKVTKAEMIPGCSYTDKRDNKYIYLGYLDFHLPDNMNNSPSSRDSVDLQGAAKKHHIYVDQELVEKGQLKRLKFKNKGGFTWLSRRNTDEPVENYAAIMDELAKSRHATALIDLETQNKGLVWLYMPLKGYYHNRDKKKTFARQDVVEMPKGIYYREHRDRTGVYEGFSIEMAKTEKYTGNGYQYHFRGYYLKHVHTISKVDGKLKFEYGNQHEWRETSRLWNRNHVNPDLYTKEELMSLNFVQLKVTLDSGAKVNPLDLFGMNSYYCEDRRDFVKESQIVDAPQEA